MGVQIIQDNAHHWGLGVGFIHQLTHLVGEVLLGPALGDGDVPPAQQRPAGQECTTLFLPRLEGVFLSCLRMPSWDVEGASPSSTTAKGKARPGRRETSKAAAPGRA